jgi:hypothetical protein
MIMANIYPKLFRSEVSDEGGTSDQQLKEVLIA